MLVGIVKFGHSQDIPNFVPPSPESVSLVKFVETPVSHYTGLPQISIPIYTIKEKGLTIPVTVDYHARGIKVEEIASRVGIGWALNFGGNISRQIRGNADEGTYGYLTTDFYSSFFTSSSTRQSVYSTKVTHPEFDLVPDQFYLNANGVSGKFVFDQADGEAVLQKFDDVEINYTLVGSVIESFKVKDSYGNVYYFGKSKNGLRAARDYDATKLITQLQGASPAWSPEWVTEKYNTWHLMEIETPDNGNVEFYYNEEIPLYYRRLYDKVVDGKVKSYFSQVIGHQYQLSEIRFSSGKLVFSPSTTERSDLNEAYALDHIELFDSNNTLVKKFQFTYEYSTSTNTSNILTYLKNIEPQAFKRLFLKQIQEKDNQNNSLPPYSFSYNATVLPNRFSNSQDVWGYYNGANNGEFLTFFNYSTFNIDRTVDEACSGAGMLQKITYPTKGYTQFTYEDNLVRPNPDLNSIVSNAINPMEYTITGLGFLDLAYYDGRAYSKPFTVQNIVGVVDVTGFWVQNPDIMDFYFYIENASNRTRYYLVVGQTTFVNLVPGDYYLKAVPKDSGFDPLNWEHAFNVNLGWMQQSVSQSEFIYAGGKRILKVENKLDDGTVTSKKEYSYVDTVGESSGALFGVPNCYTINKVLSSGGFTVFKPWGAVPGSPLNMGQGNSVGYARVIEYYGDQTTNQGKTEYEFTNVENTGEYFVFPYTIPTDNEWLRGKPLTVSEYRKNSNGTYSIVRKTDYQYLYAGGDEVYGNSVSLFIPFLAGINPIPLADDVPSNWNLLHLKTETMFRLPLAIFAFGVDDYGNIDYSDENNYKIYHLTGGTMDLYHKTVTTYSDNTPELVATTDYSYNYDHHYQLSQTETTNSNGEVIKNTYRYPQDYYYGVQNFNTLIGSNIVGKAIDIRTYNGSRLISGVQNKYNDSGQLTDVYKFESTATDIAFNGGSPYTFSHKINYQYDPDKNLVQVQPENDFITSYLWDATGRYPMAKIEGATYSQISWMNGIVSCTYSSPTLYNSLKNSVPAAHIATYSYKPLVGISTYTNLNGVTTYYEYDGFGRFHLSKDDDSQITNRYNYHYK
ncbi:hypothetical protein JCM18694_22640 [Prolixibacter denitrificans]|nr:hypothetical protein JCM18694_22640 [Prolixibacter denitrificans]